MVEEIAGALSELNAGGSSSGPLGRAACRHEALEDLVVQAASDEDLRRIEPLARELNMPAAEAFFFGRVLAAPFVDAAVERAKRTGDGGDATEDAEGCPWCGARPALAMLDQDGRRVVYCSLCGSDRPWPRLACPFCGQDEELTHGSPGRDGPYHVESCPKCRHYLKVVDRRKLPGQPPPVPLVEAVATLHLDLLAERKGLTEGPPYVALR